MEGDRAVLAVGSGSYQFTSPGAMHAAKTAYKTSEPLDQSTNPDNIDLSGAKVVAAWDFAKEPDILAVAAAQSPECRTSRWQDVSCEHGQRPAN